MSSICHSTVVMRGVAAMAGAMEGEVMDATAEVGYCVMIRP